MKNEYYSKLFSDVRFNLKKTWNTINKAMGKDNKQNSIESVNVNNNEVVDNFEIAQAFNDYFVNIGSSLTKDLESNTLNNDFVQYLNRNSTRAFFKPITPAEIITIVCNFKCNSAAGCDEIKMSIINKTIHIICYPLCNIFNSVLSTGVFPDKLKIARVVPIFKKGSKSELSNYRPISVLPAFSKILEKCIYNRLSDFLNECSIMTPFQYGFRSGHSTSHALIDLVYKVTQAFNSRIYLTGLFLDLSKAFDTLNHSFLLSKLENYGIRGVLLKLFESYLTDRKQYVIVNSTNSELREVGCGVPQGSILGPLLFLIYMNDICNASNTSQFILYADDTSVFLGDEDIATLCINFNIELQKISNWLLSNKLILNVKKTQCVIFTNKKINYDDINIKMDNERIKVVPSLKFLGVTIDSKLSWHEHINDVCNKVSKCIGVLYRLRFFPRNILLMIYNAIITPHLNYCNVSWASSTNYSMERLFRLQKKAVRIVFHANFLAHTSPIFFKLNLLNVYDLNVFNIAILMFLVFINAVPLPLIQNFNLVSEITSYEIRNPLNFYLPFYRTNAGLDSVFYKGPKVWNSLSTELKSSASSNVFKKNYKKILLQNYNKKKQK